MMGACALFSPLRSLFLRTWTLGVVLVVFGLLLQRLEHCGETFLFQLLFFLGWVHLYCHYGITLLHRLDVIDIFVILIYFLY
jgi:hypothetical protein